MKKKKHIRGSITSAKSAGNGAIKVVTESDEAFRLVPCSVNESGFQIECSFAGQAEDYDEDDMNDQIGLSSFYGASTIKQAWINAADNLEALAKACRAQAKKDKKS